MTNGATRTVLLTIRYAIKFPIFIRFNDAGAIQPDNRVTWRMFKRGFAANRLEREFSKLRHPLLCPVLFADPFGFVVVMPRLKELNDEPAVGQLESQAKRQALCPLEWKWWKAKGLPIDNFTFNYGYFQGRKVSFDYGTRYTDGAAGWFL